ncbi:MAG: hypothetical protein MjAS7_2628 [Metallosphaera javensis (ex Sakai et al. 2022)]|nr:MAG: hypothetical protein MjAS7_2628 [Metallosphaera javensis (ex Sakai et al. 2022)]
MVGVKLELMRVKLVCGVTDSIYALKEEFTLNVMDTREEGVAEAEVA